MPITKTTNGLLARREANSVNFPFVAAEWSVPAGVTATLSAGRIRIASGSVATWLIAHFTPIASRAKLYAQSVMRSSAASGTLWGGLAAHVSGAAGGHNDGLRTQFSIQRPGAEVVSFGSLVNGVEGVLTPGSLVPVKAVEVDYRTSIFVDGPIYAAHHFHDNVTGETAAAPLVNGGVGLAIGITSNRELSSLFVTTDRYLVVTDVPTGGSVEVRSAVDVVLASAAEAGGIATVDMLKVALPTAAKVVVKTSDGTVLDELTPVEGVWGGDVYLYAGSPPDQPVISVQNITHDSAELVGSAFSDPGSDHVASQWQVQEVGGDWSSPIVDSGTDLFNLLFYTADDLVGVTDYEARVRYSDGALWGDWADPAPFTTIEPWYSCEAEAAAWAPCHDSATPDPVVLDSWASFNLSEAADAVYAEDVSGNDRHAMIRGGVIAFEESGHTIGDKAFRVSADDRGIDINQLISGGLPAVAGLFSVAFWARPDIGLITHVGSGFNAADDGPNRFLTYPAHGEGTFGSDQYAGVGIALGTNAVTVIEHGHNHIPFRATYEDDLSGWHHYVVTYGGTDDGEVRIYVDSVDAELLSGVTSYFGSGRNVPFLANPLLTLTDPADWIFGFSGWISQLTIWDRVITQQEIEDHMTGSTGEIRDIWSDCEDPAATAWTES